jgi:regulator of cell morphogenesis and NO signaling
MTVITADMTLAEVVDAQPGSTRVMESLGLDYCCGGSRQLSDACRSAGLDQSSVLDALRTLAPSPPAEWRTLPPAQLADHLESTHHAYLHAELPRLDALADKVAGVHGGRHPELLDVVVTYRELRADLEPHLMKEERILFPMIRELAAATPAPAFHCGSVANPVRVMSMEHDRAGELLVRLRELTNRYETPADGCVSFRALYDGLAELEADTHLHVHKEEHVLFPAAVALEDGLRPGPT